MKKLIYGVGTNDADYKIRTASGICPFYQKWNSMLTRCYSIKAQHHRPGYKGCSVCDEWLTFSTFKAWMERQDWRGMQLDKDIINNGNKIYSPENCCFVPCQINSLLSGQSSTDLPRGLYQIKKSGTYKVSICTNGTRRYLGVFDNVADAEAAYIREKRKYIMEVSRSQKDIRIMAGLKRMADLM